MGETKSDALTCLRTLSVNGRVKRLPLSIYGFGAEGGLPRHRACCRAVSLRIEQAQSRRQIPRPLLKNSCFGSRL